MKDGGMQSMVNISDVGTLRMTSSSLETSQSKQVIGQCWAHFDHSSCHHSQPFVGKYSWSDAIDLDARGHRPLHELRVFLAGLFIRRHLMICIMCTSQPNSRSDVNRDQPRAWLLASSKAKWRGSFFRHVLSPQSPIS